MIRFRSALLVALLAVHSSLPADPVPVASRFLDTFLAGKSDFSAFSFTPEMQGPMSGGKMTAAAVGLKNCKVVGAAKTSMVGAYTVVEVPVDCGGTPLKALVSVNSADQIGGLFFQPRAASAPTTTAEYAETEVNFGAEPWVLPGTLTLPRAGDGLPAIVILGGSGPTDRDATIGANKPYRDLSHGLAQKGVAALRFDKRTLTHSAQVVREKSFTLREEYVIDAKAAVEFLRAQPRVDQKRVFVLGHSLGGVALPRVAAEQPALAGLIFCAVPARPLHTTIPAQYKYIAQLDGTISPEEQAAIDAATKEAAAVSALKDGVANGPSLLGAPPTYWLDLRAHDPIAETAKLPQRLLFLQGGRDYQVLPAEAKQWKTGLDAAGRKATWKYYPTLNHLMIPGEGKPRPEEYATAGKVDPTVIADIASFVAAK